MRRSERQPRVGVVMRFLRQGLAVGALLPAVALTISGPIGRTSPSIAEEQPAPAAPAAAQPTEAVRPQAAAPLPARNAGTPQLIDLGVVAEARTQGGAGSAVATQATPSPAPTEAAAATAAPLAVSPAPVADAATAATYAAALEQARMAFGVPGVSFAVITGGELRWTGTVGNPGGVAGPDGQASLVVGSVAKTFVAALTLRLAEEGRLALDDEVTTYLPEASIARGVTIRQLLSHTSGIADLFTSEVEAAIDGAPYRAWSRGEVLSTIGEAWFAPGAAWAYSNTNYMLLGLLIERVTGSSLADELQRQFAQPMGLLHTGLIGPDGAPGMLNPALATTFWGSGAMVSTSADLARWGQALYAGNLLAPENRAAMMRVNDDDYGLGTQRLELEEDLFAFGHSGLLGTYTTILAHLPDHDVTLAIIANRSRADLNGMLAHRAGGRASLLDLALDRPPPPPGS